MELPLIMGKLAHLLAELNLKSFFHDKDVIQFYLKPPFPWASSPSQTEKVSVLSSLWGKVFFVGYSGEKKKKKQMDTELQKADRLCSVLRDVLDRAVDPDHSPKKPGCVWRVSGRQMLRCDMGLKLELPTP